MFRRDKWWTRELERIQRAHREERAELIATIAHLAGKPLPVEQAVSGSPDEEEQEPGQRSRYTLTPEELA